MGKLSTIRDERVQVIALILLAMTLRVIASHFAATDVDEPVYRYMASYALIHGFPAGRPEAFQPVVPFLYHPPFALYALGLWLKITGSNSLLTARTFSILCSGIFLLLVYVLVRRTISQSVALLTLSLLCIDGWIIYTNQTVYLENSLIILIVLAVFLYWVAFNKDTTAKKKLGLYCVAGIATGLAIIYKHIGLYLLIGVALNLLLNRRDWKGHSILFGTALAIVGIYMISMHLIFKQIYDAETLIQFDRTIGVIDSPGINYGLQDAIAAIVSRYWVFPATIIVLISGSIVASITYAKMLYKRQKGDTVLLTWALGGVIFAVGASLKSPSYMILWLVPLYIVVAQWVWPRLKVIRKKHVYIFFAMFLVIFAISMTTFYFRYFRFSGNTLVDLERYINQVVPANAIVATEDYIGIDITAQYVDIELIFTSKDLLDSNADYMAIYWSTTQKIPKTLGNIQKYCFNQRTFSGFRDSIMVCKIDKNALAKLDLAPNLWKGKIFGYTIPEGGQGSCKKCKRPIQQSLSKKQCSWPRPVANPSHKWHVSWASRTPRSINGVRS